ncbi:MAG TPA: DUF4403 family protein, partial [Myxococcaceae bacterium]|nr:DUF4403 family protein [Myxococcaceae bacterium]
MPLPRLRPLPTLLASLALLSCAGPRTTEVQTLRPAPPVSTPGRPVSDPPPSRIVIHTTVFREALVKKLAESLPRSGEGDVRLFAGKHLHYTWQREPVSLKFDRGRIVVGVPIQGRFNMLGERQLPIDITIAAEPVITADFQALLQSTEVEVKVDGPMDAVNRGIEAKLRETLTLKLEEFRLDVRPLLTRAFARLARPIELPLGDQVACAELKLVSLEAAPTVLADGLEKDLAAVVLPSVTLPCVSKASPDAGLASTEPVDDPDAGLPSTELPPDASDVGLPSTEPVDDPDAGLASAELPPDASVEPEPEQVELPLLANVSTLPSGPFKVVIPIAARYEELSRALEGSMKGRLHFSSSHPELYLEEPAVYPSDDTVVIRMKLGGNANVGGYAVPVGGDIYFSGHPRVLDNQLTVPDLEITPGTASELV